MNDPVVVPIDWTPKARVILAAAAELFYANGIHAVGVDSIADRAGVTKKTLYARFGSKDRLVAEYLGDRDRAWRAFLSDWLAAAGSGPQQRLAAVFDAAAAWADERGGRGCAMINARAEISDPEHPALDIIRGQKLWLRGVFEEIVADVVGAGAGAAAEVEAGDGSGVKAADVQEVAESLVLVHEGAIVLAGMGMVAHPWARARALAQAILGSL